MSSRNELKELSVEEIKNIKKAYLQTSTWGAKLALQYASMIYTFEGDVFLDTNCHLTVNALVWHFFGKNNMRVEEQPSDQYYAIDFDDQHQMFKMGSKIVQSCFRTHEVTITDYDKTKSLKEHSLCPLDDNTKTYYYKHKK